MLYLTDDIITYVELPFDFGLYGEDGYLTDDATTALEDITAALWGTWLEYKQGISKVVITSVEGDYVYKFPFNGYYYDNDKVDIDEEDADFYYFCGAYGTDSSNYCNAEIEKLEYFVEKYGDTFKRMFPYTEKVQVKGVECYKQERCKDVRSGQNTSSWKPSDVVSKRNKDTIGFLAEWIGEVEKRYGTQYALNFLIFAYDELTDMHFGNYGYSEIDGRPVIIDWAGYDN